MRVLMNQMLTLQQNYNTLVTPEKLQEISEFVNENYCWEKIT
jgi:hypothetical protein